MLPLMPAPQLAKRDALMLISALGMVAHLIFKTFEPRDPNVVLSLLVVIPGALSVTLLPHFGHYISAIAITFSIYLSTLCASVVLYRISPFHPLARYPGPVANKVSKLWMAWISAHGKRHIYYERLHNQYGDVVRVGPNELSIRDPSAIVPLHGPEGLPKGPQIDGQIKKSPIPNLIFIRDRVLHAQRRTYWQRGLNSAALKGYEPIIEKRAGQFVDRLENSEGSEIDLAQLLSYFSYDVMNDMAFGGGSEMIRDGDIHNLWKLQLDAITLAFLFGHIPWMAPFISRLPFLAGDLHKFIRFGIEAAKRRKREGSQYKDLFYHLIDEGGVDKDPPSLVQVISDGGLAIIAGSNTTATALSNLFCFLLANPQAYQRLQAEVDRFYPAGEDAASTRFHGDMPYLVACINESLRLLPPVPDGSQRGSMKGMGTKMIGSYDIPEGTAVFTHFYSIQRDPRNFSPKSDQFWPERWLIADGLESPPPQAGDFIHNVSAFSPFSSGPANCVGKGLALQEIKTLVCMVMQRLGIRFADGYDSRKWFDDMQSFGALTRGRLPVVVTARQK